jgi:hypothetical protein
VRDLAGDDRRSDPLFEAFDFEAAFRLIRVVHG